MRLPFNVFLSYLLICFYKKTQAECNKHFKAAALNM